MIFTTLFFLIALATSHGELVHQASSEHIDHVLDDPTISEKELFHATGYQYNDPNEKILTLFCTDYISHTNWTTYGDVPSYPNVGGLGNMGEEGRTCGWCYNATYNGRSLLFTVLSATLRDVYLSKVAYAELAGRDVDETTLKGTIEEVSRHPCPPP